MAWRRKNIIPPVRWCCHKMVWTITQCWCEHCGQTWGWVPKPPDDSGKSQGGVWSPQLISQVKFGEYAEEEF